MEEFRQNTNLIRTLQTSFMRSGRTGSAERRILSNMLLDVAVTGIISNIRTSRNIAEASVRNTTNLYFGLRDIIHQSFATATDYNIARFEEVRGAGERNYLAVLQIYNQNQQIFMLSQAMAEHQRGQEERQVQFWTNVMEEFRRVIDEVRAQENRINSSTRNTVGQLIFDFQRTEQIIEASKNELLLAVNNQILEFRSS
jgi:hypothetical protein